MPDHATLSRLADVVLEAARAIMAVRGRAEIIIKGDGSPVTEADLAADVLLQQGLCTILPDWAQISEERQPDRAGQHVIFIDPIDGTKEFIKGSDEFCISLGGVVDGRPDWGLLCAPALGCLWIGGAFGAEQWICPDLQTASIRQNITTRQAHAPFTALISRSQPEPDCEALLKPFGACRMQSCGSALKFARIATGEADLYLTSRRIHAWDIAGGHALVVAAGGAMRGLDGTKLNYHDRGPMPGFVAVGDQALFKN